MTSGGPKLHKTFGFVIILESFPVDEALCQPINDYVGIECSQEAV